MAVSPDDIAVALGRTVPTSPEVDQWRMWIADALMLIENRLVGEDAGQVASLDDLDQAKLDYVVREAVRTHILRPDDATTVDIRVDDAAVGKTYRTSAGRVTIRDEWWTLLAPTVKSGAFTIDTFPSGGLGAHAPWCSIFFDSTATCSCGVTLAGAPIYEPYW